MKKSFQKLKVSIQKNKKIIVNKKFYLLVS